MNKPVDPCGETLLDISWRDTDWEQLNSIMEKQSEVNHFCFIFFPDDVRLSPLVALLDCMCFSAFCYLINPSTIPQQQVADNDTFHQLSLPQAPAITRCPDSQSVRLPLNNNRSQFCTIMYKSVVRSSDGSVFSTTISAKYPLRWQPGQGCLQRRFTSVCFLWMFV